jgi:hypothetical protein
MPGTLPLTRRWQVETIGRAVMDERKPHLSGTEARAGQKTNTVRYILGISLAAIVVIFAIILILNR